VNSPNSAAPRAKYTRGFSKLLLLVSILFSLGCAKPEDSEVECTPGIGENPKWLVLTIGSDNLEYVSNLKTCGSCEYATLNDGPDWELYDTYNSCNRWGVIP
jgi:hypothetical protein